MRFASVPSMFFVGFKTFRGVDCKVASYSGFVERHFPATFLKVFPLSCPCCKPPRPLAVEYAYYGFDM